MEKSYIHVVDNISWSCVVSKTCSKGICVNYKTLDRYKNILIAVVRGTFLNAINFMGGVKREI